MRLVKLVSILTNGNDDSMSDSVLSNVFTYENLVHAVSGAVGSVVSMIVFYPLDTARTRLQVDEKIEAKHSPIVIADIVRQEGLSSLYRGLVPALVTLWCSNFVYFYTYDCLKAVYLGGEKSSPVKDLTFAYIAGAINVLVTTPLWVASTRLKLQGVNYEGERSSQDKSSTYVGIVDCMLKIMRQEGVGTLWNGTKPSLVLAANPAIQFMVYEAIKRHIQATLQQTELSGLLYFIIGAIAKTVATVITYPLQIIQSRVRSNYSKGKKYAGMIQSVLQIVRFTGFKGLYKGMEAKLLQTVLTAALMFMIYEKIAAFTFRVMGVEYIKAVGKS